MRLLNVSTLDFEEVADPATKKYAILSHTWVEGEEVSLQDWQKWRRKRRGWEDVAKRSGLAKILDACKMTQEYDLKYLWVDTNCIDKLSSAELSEAINSMFKWYSLSAICFAYLSDVRSPVHPGNNADSGWNRHLMKDSRWFTRGWTLQELVAPGIIYFFSYDWTVIGTRSDLSFIISTITAIEEKYLDGSNNFRLASIATRMSWAASRQTSRIEDMAYSLLGIFDINMPLLYGEGEGAFIRLQEEILKVSTDQTIFAWRFVDEIDWKQFRPHPNWVSVLAPSPICFFHSKSVEKAPSGQLGAYLETWSMTNLGFTMHLPLLYTTNSRRLFAVLQCTEQEASLLCIPVIKINGELVRAAWPPEPLPLCRLNKQPHPVSVYLPRFNRYGSREEIWESPTFIQPPLLLVFITTSLVGYDVEGWITTPGVEFYSDLGLLSIVDDEHYEGVYLGFKKHDERRIKFTAVVFSDPLQLKIVSIWRKNFVHCQLWLADETFTSWKGLWGQRGDSDASISLGKMLPALLKPSMKLNKTAPNGVLTRTNPRYDLEAVLTIRDNSFQMLTGVGYTSVLIRAMDHALGF
ncbi:HET-domain-containing protein [Xylaria sp. FL0043]|nr:HET-domain-containing protein [Xylaria sp. FL0043]